MHLKQKIERKKNCQKELGKIVKKTVTDFHFDFPLFLVIFDGSKGHLADSQLFALKFDGHMGCDLSADSSADQYGGLIERPTESTISTNSHD